MSYLEAVMTIYDSSEIIIESMSEQSFQLPK